MNRIFKLLISERSFLVFVFLELFSLILIIRSHQYARLKTHAWRTALSGSLYQKLNDFNSFLALQSYNDSLLKQNARLLQQLNNPTDEKFHINRKGQYDFIPAYVISNQYKFNHNTLMLNKGRLDSVKPDMGVISDKAIVGIVQKTSKHFSRVVSILNKDLKISVALSHTNYTGFLQWNGNDPNYFEVVDMPVNAMITKGDTIVSAGNSNYFPKGINDSGNPF